MMETDKETGIKRQFMPITHFSAVLGLDDFLKGNLFQAEFERVMAQLIEHYDRVSENIDSKSKEIEEHADQKIAEFDKKVVGTEAAIKKVETDLAETKKGFDSLDVFNKQESSANVINIITGKDKVQMKFEFNFIGKLAGSSVANPHYASVALGTNTLPQPSDFINELSQVRYDSLKALNANYVTVNTTPGVANQYASLELEWNLIDPIIQQLGDDFFSNQGATDVASRANIVKNLVNGAIESSAWGFGTNPNGYNLSIANLVNGSWQVGTTPSNSTNAVKKITARNTASPTINADGTVKTIVYSDKSATGGTSQINVDFANLAFTIEISMNDYFEYVIAAYCGGLNEISFEKVGEV